MNILIIMPIFPHDANFDHDGADHDCNVSLSSPLASPSTARRALPKEGEIPGEQNHHKYTSDLV